MFVIEVESEPKRWSISLASLENSDFVNLGVDFKGIWCNVGSNPCFEGVFLVKVDCEFDTDAFMLAVRLAGGENGEEFLAQSGYPDDVKMALRRIVAQDRDDVNEELDLLKEVTNLITGLRSTRDRLDEADTSEKNMYFRTMTMNLSTLVELKNGILRKGQFDAFVEIVLDFMERYLDKDEISDLHRKLREQM